MSETRGTRSKPGHRDGKVLIYQREIATTSVIKEIRLTIVSFFLLLGRRLLCPFGDLLFGCWGLGKNVSKKFWTGIGPMVIPVA